VCVEEKKKFLKIMEMAMSSEDWEHHVVNPLLQDMHCGDEEYFNPQEVSLYKKNYETFSFHFNFF
jgi:hypothetical protein